MGVQTQPNKIVNHISLLKIIVRTPDSFKITSLVFSIETFIKKKIIKKIKKTTKTFQNRLIEDVSWSEQLVCIH